ncbi:hypothetical protein DICPUDRAFT_36912, partial [Dictyostelium purpureum]
ILILFFYFFILAARDAVIEKIEYTVGDTKLYFTGEFLNQIKFNDTDLFVDDFNDLSSNYTDGYFVLKSPLEKPYTIVINTMLEGIKTLSIFVHNCLNDCSGANGNCNVTTFKCECNSGWGGTDCSIDQTFECRNNCSGNGRCNSDMTCNCNPGYNGVACDLFTKDLGLSMKMNKSKTSPTIHLGSFDMNSSNKSLQMNQYTKASDYSIFISYIQEVDTFGKLVQVYNLTQALWYLVSSNQSVSIYETELSIGSKFLVTIELIPNVTERIWANQLTVIPANSIKYSIRASNYTFSSNLNKLEMFYQATPSSQLECAIKQQIAWGAKKSTDMHWVTIPNNQLQLYGRFSNYMILDDQIISTSNEGLEFGATIQVKVNIPFFKDYVELDPDFSVLVDVNMDETVYDECGNPVGTKSNRKWVIPVAIVVSVCGATILFIAVFSIAYKKNTNLRTKVLSFKSKINTKNNISMKKV